MSMAVVSGRMTVFNSAVDNEGKKETLLGPNMEEIIFQIISISRQLSKLTKTAALKSTLDRIRTRSTNTGGKGATTSVTVSASGTHAAHGYTRCGYRGLMGSFKPTRSCMCFDFLLDSSFSFCG